MSGGDGDGGRGTGDGQGLKNRVEDIIRIHASRARVRARVRWATRRAGSGATKIGQVRGHYSIAGRVTQKRGCASGGRHGGGQVDGTNNGEHVANEISLLTPIPEYTAG